MAKTKESRTTVVLKPRIYRRLKSRAAGTKQDISEYVNTAVEEALREDALDSQAFRKTRKERSIPLQEVERELKRDGLL